MGRNLIDGLKLNKIVNAAEEAFWAEIAKAFPHIKTGDLSPDADIPFKTAARDVVRAWVDENTPDGPAFGGYYWILTEQGWEIAEWLCSDGKWDRLGHQYSATSDEIGVYAWRGPIDTPTHPTDGDVLWRVDPKDSPLPSARADAEKGLGHAEALNEDWGAFVAQLPVCNGWSATWEYPGFIAWRKRGLQLEVVATPDWDSGDAEEIVFDLRDESGEVLKVFGGKRWDDLLPWPKAERTVDSYMERMREKLTAIDTLVEEHRNAARRALIDAGFEEEGDFEITSDSFCPIDEEAPGAWVSVLVWVDTRDLTFEEIKRCRNCTRPLDDEGQCRAGCSQEGK